MPVSRASATRLAPPPHTWPGLRLRPQVLVYLNRGWRHEWGGQLRVFGDAAGGSEGDDERGAAGEETSLDVYPEGSTLVLMRSRRVPHEVMITHQPRHCIVGWFRAMSVRGRTVPSCEAF